MTLEKVVDLWGGVRNKVTREPWDEDTMVVVWSATKGLAGMTLAVAHSRGWLDYDERVSAYWPEFAQNGKAAITVRQLLAHQAGLFAFDEPVDKNVVGDPDRLALVLARQTPAWPPGARQSYHALTLGFYEGERTARAIARPYGELATGGRELGLRRETLDALSAPPIPSSNGFYDDGLMGTSGFRWAS
jgi:hypothetical protein